MDYAAKLERRKEYNRHKADIQKSQSDMLRRFAEANPERYAELMAQAQQESALRPSGHAVHDIIDDSRRQETMRRFDEVVLRFRAGRKDYFVLTRDPWGTEHRYFETLNPDPSPEEVLDELRERHPNFQGELVSVRPCTCPLCS